MTGNCRRSAGGAYVLSSRQMGKSSLMARTAEVLRREGIAVATLDLTPIGSHKLNAEK